ncbi:DUF2786 domain-containing protein [Glycomyces buryatensis]|uniref:DUF2786 domain-containing protein n=1 Tax=Glycomyces buryatensis TaxID=2570927 RepID=A0A4S8QNL2_9ACTN|nr:DUF2786 domain-containing protein [Glycomyces buryatensis]THV43029.1 DUF2786 domain-containing protein [Glycomyces buryatensis]
MGKNNQQRRKTKAKSRKQRPQSGPGRGGSAAEQDGLSGLPIEGRARYAVLTILQETAREELDWVDAASHLEGQSSDEGWPAALARTFGELGDDTVAHAWQQGWMPREVVSAFRKSLSAEAVRAAKTMMRGQLARYPEAQLSDRWRAHREELVDQTEFEDIAAAVRGLGRWDRIVLWAGALEAFPMFSTIPSIPKVEPLPGSPVVAHGFKGAESSKIYTKIQALLAKAEATGSDAEAEAFTAKAQQLIARHSVNEALLSQTGHGKREPDALRVIIERPYEMPKSELLAQIASANHCRPVYWPDGGFTTLIGDRDDLRSVELLYNSLLVQATATMTRAGSVSSKAGRSQTRSFRQSFLASFAGRIGERLRASAGDTTREVAEETGTDLVPVMRQRDERVDARTEELFPNLKYGRGTRITNYEGHVAGLAAADAARLTAGEPITPS